MESAEAQIVTRVAQLVQQPELGIYVLCIVCVRVYCARPVYPVRYRCAAIVMYLYVLCKCILHSQCKWRCRCFGVFQVG
jgi:hypothetical protein